MKKQLHTLVLLLTLNALSYAQKTITYYKPVLTDYRDYMKREFYKDFETNYFNQLAFNFKKDDVKIDKGYDAWEYWRTADNPYALLTFIETDYAGYEVQTFLVFKEKSEHILGYAHTHIRSSTNSTQLSASIAYLVSNISKAEFESPHSLYLRYEELTLNLKPDLNDQSDIKAGKEKSNLIFPLKKIYEPQVYYGARICNRLLNYLEANIAQGKIDPLLMNNYASEINLVKFESISENYPFTYHAIVITKELANQLYQKSTPIYSISEVNSLNKQIERFKQLSDTIWLSKIEKYLWKRLCKHYSVLPIKFYNITEFYFENKCNELKKLMQAKLNENCYNEAQILCNKIMECDARHAQKYLKEINKKKYAYRDDILKGFDKAVSDAMAEEFKKIGDENGIYWGSRIEKFKREEVYTLTEPKLNMTLTRGIEYNSKRNLPSYFCSIETNEDKFTIRIMQGRNDLKLHHSNNKYGMGEYKLYNQFQHINAVTNIINVLKTDHNIDINDTSLVLKKLIANTDGGKFKSSFKAKKLAGKFSVVKSESLSGIYHYDEFPENNDGWNARLGSHRINEWAKGLKENGILFSEIPELRLWESINPELRGVEVVLVIKKHLNKNTPPKINYSKSKSIDY